MTSDTDAAPPAPAVDSAAAPSAEQRSSEPLPAASATDAAAADPPPVSSSAARSPREGSAGDDGSPRGRRPRHRRGRRAPIYTPDEVKGISYKDVDRLRRIISERGRIDPRRKTGLTAADQRRLATAVKRARHVALLPYTAEHMRLAAQYRQASRPPRTRQPEPESEAPLPASEADTSTDAVSPAVQSQPSSEPEADVAPPADAPPSGGSDAISPAVQSQPSSEPEADVAPPADAPPSVDSDAQA